jgi:hypothetical protein
MAKASSQKKSRRGAKASRSAFRAKPAKKKPAAKKPAAKKKPAKAAKKPAPKPAPKKAAPVITPLGDLVLGEITVPSGQLGIFDIGLFGYLPLPALEPAIVKAEVPRDRPLAVVGRKVGVGRFAERWDHVSIVLGDGVAVATKKLGEAGVDFAHLAFLDLALLPHWQHDDSLDGRADVIFSGRDERLLASAMVAPRATDGYGWVDLPLAQAEAKADVAARKKAENRWLLDIELRPHSHHFHALAAVRGNRFYAGTLELAGARMMLLLTGWGVGVVPIYVDVDASDRPVRIRIQLATIDAAN